MQLKEAIKSRKSTKRFGDRKPNWRKIIQAIDAARYAPMAGNQFNLKFILSADSKKISQIADSADQLFIKKAQYLLVIITDEEKVTKAYDKNGEKFSHQQSGAAIENILLTLEDNKVASCWVGWFDESEVKNLFNVPDRYKVEAMIAIGTDAKTQTQRPRKIELDPILFFEKWDNKIMDKNFY